MINPSEIVYWEILPAIRKNLVLELKDAGLKQTQIAMMFDMTPSAISQYVKNKRGEFEFTEVFSNKIQVSARKIKDGHSNVFQEINLLVKEFESDRNLCKVCRAKNDMTSDCGICFK